ncbi:GNAT family N-acetyltransferase [Sagittula sp. NFXS13]|uniref:GNAT family N-acetyltransferase n=1 Tax=Sagittula sp. NFXS13 TaxID=2819095 RepID=UPI0032DE8DAE
MTPETLADISARAYRHMRPWTAASFADSLANPHALLSHSDHAFVLGLVIAGEAEILALAADPDHQRTGQASVALAAFHADAQKAGAAQVFLEVARSNAPAIAFYERHGYAVAGLRKGYYPQPGGPPDDALVMSRTLA